MQIRTFFQPSLSNIIKIFVKIFGNARQKELLGILKRPHYAYSLFRAADIAIYFGKNKTTIAEFGVASGDGLMNLIELSEIVTEATGVEFRIFGLDSGQGIPNIESYKDHPEMWIAGDFRMSDKEQLLKKINDRAELIIGDIKDTVDIFVSKLSTDAPLGFISIDTDVYTGAKHALRCLTSDVGFYNPAVTIYFDDVNFYFANRWCGELAAIEEFNSEQQFRKIDKDRTCPGSRPFHDLVWYENMYIAHILDHPRRTNIEERNALDIDKHGKLIKGI
ncbi:MAG: hypothetical protein HW421_1076 [Ignavibacteria bacterium]|nr:hypothetical protein [Ignavibacteria bacterium]